MAFVDAYSIDTYSNAYNNFYAEFDNNNQF